MDNVYSIAKDISSTNFRNVAEDDKQLVLYTDYQKVDGEEAGIYGWTRAILIFTKDSEGNLKILAFNNANGAILLKGERTDKEVKARLEEMISDKDNDFYPDEEETEAGNDPALRDTDGDGWWDGVERYFE